MHDRLVANDGHDATTSVQVTALGEGDQALCERAKALGLGLGGGDPAVLEQRGGQVGQHEPFVGRAAAETGALGWRRHGFSSVLSRQP